MKYGDAYSLAREFINGRKLDGNMFISTKDVYEYLKSLKVLEKMDPEEAIEFTTRCMIQFALQEEGCRVLMRQSGNFGILENMKKIDSMPELERLIENKHDDIIADAKVFNTLVQKAQQLDPGFMPGAFHINLDSGEIESEDDIKGTLRRVFNL